MKYRNFCPITICPSFLKVSSGHVPADGVGLTNRTTTKKAMLIVVVQNQIKSLLLRGIAPKRVTNGGVYHCNEWRGLSLRLSAWATQLRRTSQLRKNITADAGWASGQAHSVRFDRPGKRHQDLQRR